MKFYVIANKKYLLSVDAETHGAAEHKLLDNFHYFVDMCQAFKFDETKIMFEMFPDFEIISFEKLKILNMKAEIKYHYDKCEEHRLKAESILDSLTKMGVSIND